MAQLVECQVTCGADVGLTPGRGSGFSFQGHLPVQTLLRCLYSHAHEASQVLAAIPLSGHGKVHQVNPQRQNVADQVAGKLKTVASSTVSRKMDVLLP